MKTIEEINEIAPYKANEWQEGYGIWQQGYMQGQKDGATEQKAIDIDKACSIIESLNWDISAETGKMINIDAFRKAIEE